MFNIAIFASGSGSNAENIINYFKERKDVSVKIIISNKEEAYVHQRAENLGIESITFSKNWFENTNKVLDCLIKKEVNFIVLAGFLLKVPQNIIDAYPQKIINVHPALLPKFGGKGMYGDNVHKAVVAAKESESGITIHYINENYDEGSIICQFKCAVLPTDSYDDVAEKVHRLEYLHFPQVIDQVINEII